MAGQGRGKGGSSRRVGAGWEGQAEEAFLDLRGWRELHPRARLAEIEGELDRRLEQMRAGGPEDCGESR